jgi:cytochrome c-type biogenesis protein
MTSLILLAFIAGILTVLAPCVLPLLPIIIGSSIGSKYKLKPYLVTLGLVLSITIFTILLKASTLLITVDINFWKVLSSLIVISFGISYLFPKLWDLIAIKLGLTSKTDNLLDKVSQNEGWINWLLVGGALGPVFASCSPTYALIIATILPVNFFEGLLYIIVYAIGLATILLGIALLGRNLIQRLKVFADPNGWFKKSLGIVFILVGLAILTGIDKKIETYILNSGFFDVTKFEQSILDYFNIF